MFFHNRSNKQDLHSSHYSYILNSDAISKSTWPYRFFYWTFIHLFHSPSCTSFRYRTDLFHWNKHSAVHIKKNDDAVPHHHDSDFFQQARSTVPFCTLGKLLCPYTSHWWNRQDLTNNIIAYPLFLVNTLFGFISMKNMGIFSFLPLWNAWFSGFWMHPAG